MVGKLSYGRSLPRPRRFCLALIPFTECNPLECEKASVFRPLLDARSQANAEWVRTVMLNSHSGARDPWRLYHESVVSFIKAHFPEQPMLTWVEIGTAFGMTTDYVLKSLPNVTAHAVDPCEAGYDMADNTARVLNKYRVAGNMSSLEFSMAWASALLQQQVLQQRSCRYFLHRSRSTDGAVHFADASIDVLFIDGLHTYQGVMDDLEAYWPKLKPRSLLILNDWKAVWNCPCRNKVRERACHCAFPGVKNAGCTFLATKGLQHQVIEQGPVGTTNAAVVLGMASQAAAKKSACASVLTNGTIDRAVLPG